MNMQLRFFHAFTFVAGLAILVFSGHASADPPSRVARLGYTSGAVSFSPSGEDDWVQASINRPLTTGDRLWADARSRAEIQVGGAMIRMSAETDVSILNLDDQITQLQLTQGALNVRVRRLEPDQALEVDTPNLAFTVRQPGAYRIEVDPDGKATTIFVRNGQGEVYGEGAAYLIDARQPYRFSGTGLREYQTVDMPALDEFDRWASDRDRTYDASASVRYVSQDVIGYEELDAYGAWRDDATYGNVWIPTHVGADWAPYRDGYWAWVDPWGWTWIDDAPWGFAVSHYGRWASLKGTWCWVPGPVQTRVYYAPAMVAFVGGDAAVGVAWFPLGPREVYRPPYSVSRVYFENVNRSNTIVETTVINNYYNNTNVTNVVYVNRQVPGAVVVVPTTAFAQSQPVGKHAMRVPQDKLVSRPVAIAPPVAPTERSVRGPAAQGGKPPPHVVERAVVARAAPPSARVGFAAQQQQLAASPGKPLDDDARKQLKVAPARPAPAVRVIAQRPEAPPTAPPPMATRGSRPGETNPGEARGRSDERKGQEPRVLGNTPGAPAQVTPPTQSAPPVPAAPAEERGRPGQPGLEERRGQPVPPARLPEQRPRPEDLRENPIRRPPAEQVPTPPPHTVRPMPDAQPPEQPARPVQRDRDEQQRAQPPESRPPQPRPAPNAEPREQEPRPPANKSDDRKKRGNDPRDEEKRGQKP